MTAGRAVVRDHGPDDEAQRARSVFYVLVDSAGVVGTVAVHPGKGGAHQASPGGHCHSTPSLAAIGCHSLGVYTVILLSLLSFFAEVTVLPPGCTRRAARRTPRSRSSRASA